METPLYDANGPAGMGVLRLRLPKTGAGCAQHDKTSSEKSEGGIPGLARRCLSVPLWLSPSEHFPQFTKALHLQQPAVAHFGAQLAALQLPGVVMRHKH